MKGPFASEAFHNDHLNIHLLYPNSLLVGAPFQQESLMQQRGHDAKAPQDLIHGPRGSGWEFHSEKSASLHYINNN